MKIFLQIVWNLIYLWDIWINKQAHLTKHTMKTLENNKTRKIKTIEIQYSNMTFIVQAYSHFIICKKSSWSTTKYTASIKETGKGIGLMGGRKLIKKQMELINSMPELFLN